MNGKLETVHTLVELGVDKDAKDKVRNLMMMMMMMMMMMIMMMSIRVVETMMMMILVDDKNDCR